MLSKRPIETLYPGLEISIIHGNENWVPFISHSEPIRYRGDLGSVGSVDFRCGNFRFRNLVSVKILDLVRLLKYQYLWASDMPRKTTKLDLVWRVAPAKRYVSFKLQQFFSDMLSAKSCLDACFKFVFKNYSWQVSTF